LRKNDNIRWKEEEEKNGVASHESEIKSPHLVPRKWIIARTKSSTAKELDAWAKRLLTAASLDDVFRG
jgi:hypothetical protein